MISKDILKVLYLLSFYVKWSRLEQSSASRHVSRLPPSLGILTPSCVKKYDRVFVNRTVPPRQYLYYHEVLEEQADRRRQHSGARSSDETALTASSEENLSFRIVGGYKIPIEDAPFQVMYGKYCGGTLIAPDWVITAAHCKNKSTFVAVGSALRSRATNYNICAHFIHPGWFNPNKIHNHDFDYQLVLLDTSIPITKFVRPIAIGTEEDLKPGDMLDISGWGHQSYRDGIMPDALHKVSVPLIDTQQCRNLNIPEYNLTSRMFCAGFMEGEKDACQGDSGGPVVSNGYLVGSVSFGIGCALKEKPGVYANIPHVRKWIREVTALPL